MDYRIYIAVEGLGRVPTRFGLVVLLVTGLLPVGLFAVSLIGICITTGAIITLAIGLLFGIGMGLLWGLVIGGIAGSIPGGIAGAITNDGLNIVYGLTTGMSVGIVIGGFVEGYKKRKKVDADPSKYPEKKSELLQELNGGVTPYPAYAFPPIFPPQAYSPAIQPQTQNKQDVVVSRDWEYIGGSIRLKIAVINHSEGILVDVRLRPVFAEKAFALDRVEPSALEYIDGEVKLNNLAPGEKKTCAIYLDPLICTTSDFEALLMFRDSSGKLQTVTMTAIKISVACPSFFRPGEASVASVRNLVENQLEKKDCRVYVLPTGFDPKNAFNVAKEVISSHSVSHVRDCLSKTPWSAEAWYYGLTRTGEQPFVILARAFSEDRTLVLSAYASSAQNICGLLAELHTQLNVKLQDQKYIETPLTQVTNLDIRNSVINRSSILLTRECDTGGGDEKTVCDT